LMSKVYEPLPGVRAWINKKGALILRLHHTADPKKTMAWYEEQAKSMDFSYARQEYQIDFGATSGQLLYHLTDEYTLEDEFTIPESWTRYHALDPHPRKPFASLWGAADPNGIIHIYRELWPSKIYGRPGRVPEDDNRVPIPHYVEMVAWLESKDNPQNDGKREKIHERIIDYAGRAFKASNLAEDDGSIHYQRLIEDAADAIDKKKYPGFGLMFTDAIKAEKSAGIEVVNELMLPLEFIKRDGSGYEKRSKLRIMRQRCPELIWQLKHNRIATQSSHQKDLSDPEMKVLQIRNDLSDCLLYLCRNGIEYRERKSVEEQPMEQMYPGVAY
jgi:hypothetical protein